jgi:hypothetical protein
MQARRELVIDSSSYTILDSGWIPDFGFLITKTDLRQTT